MSKIGRNPFRMRHFDQDEHQRPLFPLRLKHMLLQSPRHCLPEKQDLKFFEASILPPPWQGNRGLFETLEPNCSFCMILCRGLEEQPARLEG